MFNITLHFPTIEQLWDFKVKLSSRSITLCTRLNVLTAQLPEEEILLACTFYKAAIVQKQKVERVMSLPQDR